jgi:hypothetical protein
VGLFRGLSEVKRYEEDEMSRGESAASPGTRREDVVDELDDAEKGDLQNGGQTCAKEQPRQRVCIPTVEPATITKDDARLGRWVDSLLVVDCAREDDSNEIGDEKYINEALGRAWSGVRKTKESTNSADVRCPMSSTEEK